MGEVPIDRKAIELLGKLTTIVLVGGTGSGKSATGNSILGRQGAFKSGWSLSGVTNTCEQKFLKLSDDKILSIIDTPGLFDSSTEAEKIQKEIARCMEYAKEGIHAIVLVTPLLRYTNEQIEVTVSLKRLFGESIANYMIVAFTRGDKLKGQSLDATISQVPALKALLETCGNRKVVFNNKAKDEDTQLKQRSELLELIGKTVKNNGNKPYTENLNPNVKALQDKMKEEYEANINKLKQDLEKRKMEVAVHKANMNINKLEQDLEERKMEVAVHGANINKLKQDLEKLKMEVAVHGNSNGELLYEIIKLTAQLMAALIESVKKVSCTVM